MVMAEIGPNTRLRVSPFYDATVREGVAAFSPYNSMLMPVSYGDSELEYHRLMNGVKTAAGRIQFTLRSRSAGRW